MVCVLWQEECETKIQETYEEYQNLEDIMKEIWKEYEDKDGSKGGGSVQEISRLMNIFKDRWWKLVMENLEAKILSEDMMKMYSKPNGSIAIPKNNILLTSSREWS